MLASPNGWREEDVPVCVRVNGGAAGTGKRSCRRHGWESAWGRGLKGIWGRTRYVVDSVYRHPERAMKRSS